MKIGIPKEIKNNENRVGMTPAGVAEFIRHGHEVMVQHTAGENSGFAGIPAIFLYCRNAGKKSVLFSGLNDLR